MLVLNYIVFIVDNDFESFILAQIDHRLQS